ncbi:MAG: hypothetical protein HFH85_03305 [Lachnospiraceae bacterium]|jgi:hypothetical protein|nr:hypothetical protein [Lachnospiraceae bacterium]
MLKWEEKIIDWINRYMLLTAAVFVVIAAAWMRMGGRNYVGNDYHCTLYDVPGNCNSFLFRRLADFLMLHFADNAITLLKLLAYAGDFAVTFLVLLICRKDTALKRFILLTAFLLSPVTLLYSVSGMKPDSVCMSLLLLGYLCFRRGLSIPAMLLTQSAGFLYPAYWPVSIIAGLCMVNQARKYPSTLPAAQSASHDSGKLPIAGKRMKKTNNECLTTQTVILALLMAFCLLLSVFMENSSPGNDYFWGKIFVTNPFTAEIYSGFLPWLGGMCRIYGYLTAVGLTLLAVRCRKLRIPALLIQAAVIMYIGWQQTFFMAL